MTTLNTKRGFGRVWIIIIIFLALVVGVYLLLAINWWPTSSDGSPTSISPTSISNKVLVNLLLNSNGFQNGEKRASVPNPDGPLSETILRDQIIFGDLDGDGKDEAVAPLRYCAASCGLGVYVFTFGQNNVTMSPVQGITLSGSGKDIKDIQIEKGVLSVTETLDGKTWWTDRFKMNGGVMMKILLLCTIHSQTETNLERLT